MEENKEKKKKDDWIRMASKSRPGRFYMFNKATGETQWLPLNQVTELEQQESPPKLSIKKVSKTPAQDRLKRLQHNLKSSQINSGTSRTTRHYSGLEDKSKEQENKSNEKPSTSSSKIIKEKSPRKSYKRSQSGSLIKETENSVKITKSSADEEAKDICLSDSSNSTTSTSNKSTKMETHTKIIDLKSITQNNTNSEHLSNMEKDLTSCFVKKINEQPSTSSSKLLMEKSPKKATKRSSSGSLIKETEKISKSSTEEEPKKIRLSDSSNSPTSTSNKSTEMETETDTNELKSITLNNNNFEHLSNMEQDNSSSLNNFRCGIVKKIKEICKIPFNISKKKIEEKSSAKVEKSSGIINTNHFKPVRKTKDNNIQGLSLLAALEATSQLREESTKNSVSPNTSTKFSTTKNINIPTYPRGSANSRLERLKQSLQLEHEQHETSTSTNYSNQLNDISNTSCESNNNTMLLKLENNRDTDHNNSTKSLNETANNTIDDDIEAMDWQPIVKDEDLVEVSSSESSFIIEKSKKLVFSTNDSNENATMGDIYDTVNENLLRFSAEKHKDSANHQRKWRKDYYYFVVDTNVLLKDLTFVEDLTKMKLCDTKGSMLYIPYSVLQELDKLKMRSGCQEGVKTLAVRAIKYLNSKFENNSLNLQAQSALDERHHLVDINSADDSIMNCCLQAKKYVPNLLLLTEDVNLRNKAICNNILVSTKSDLVSKRYDKS